MIRYIADMPRSVKGAVMLAADAFLLPLSLWTAIGLRLDAWSFPQLHAPWVYLLTSVTAIPIFIRIGLYRAVVRYMEERALLMVTVGVTLSIALFVGVLTLLQLPPIPRGALAIYWFISVFYICVSRFIARAILRHAEGSRAMSAQRVAIYGAGSAGRQLAMALRAGAQYRTVAFIDDAQRMEGLEILGVKVHSSATLSQLISRYNIQQVLLAIPSASRSRRHQIIRTLEKLQVEVRVVPGMEDLVGGEVQLSDIREVSIDELLGRDAVPPDQTLLQANIRGKAVMVTGAGGSIGSELCRQIILHQPKILVLYEQSEFALYSVDQELQGLAALRRSPSHVIPVLGSVANETRLTDIMRRYGIETVYHAAAYKHVPLVEFNLTEGVLNNTFGTLAAVNAALAADVESFVLISTDKAVRPTNVMGASKRCAELILQAHSAASAGRTRFCMVRFGNVLGSSGSVVPLFRRQIREGGPVTVTHPDITRYFMTIPEAAQLVIQASAMSRGGEVFVLDMGEPVTIVDLARRMIHLSGFSVRDVANPHGDIEIQFSGLRAGEKLYEELLIGDDTTGTAHPKIMMANEHFFPLPELNGLLNGLRRACESGDHAAIIDHLRRCVSGFNYGEKIRDHLCEIAAPSVKPMSPPAGNVVHVAPVADRLARRT
ncbi:polysaccharide biosynthesis protein [Pandoraea cepalis]|uniref:Polysaccharide biosynthesis protein n=1 Tax=Pandoraea cepalis TaxID=2508294 RepID=A0AAW7MUC5_9BURK|nr:nucleoside-diphosphate sugar epimerase/dehydratase [Pandoraea cepalis]MDN4576472.1 polysaccharide biosynthesis protein [Pandoraea cepalis]MDN4578598.1 polysaccharide biosynthesis protein [Pandoraea cepalis]